MQTSVSGRHAERGQDVLGRRLPHRARDPGDVCAAAVAHRASEHGEGGEGVVRHERGDGAALACVGEELLAASDRDEEIAGGDAPGIDLDAGELGRLPLHPPEAVEQRRLERDHAGALSRRSASRATSASSNGSFCPAIS
jgi:hypothetical protein